MFFITNAKQINLRYIFCLRKRQALYTSRRTHGLKINRLIHTFLSERRMI